MLVEVAHGGSEGREDGDLRRRTGLEDINESGQLGVVRRVKVGQLVADGCQLFAVGAHGVAVVGIEVARGARVGVALQCLLDPIRQAGLAGLGVRRLAQCGADGTSPRVQASRNAS